METTLPTNNHLGIDVSKPQLDVFIGGTDRQFPNTPKGHNDLIAAIRLIEHPCVICEATGGYERALVQALMAADIPVAIVQPARVRHFALAEGLLAKTDRIDARLLARFGEKIQPRREVPSEPDAIRLRQMLEMRRVLVDQITETNARLELAEGYLQSELRKLVNSLATRLVRIEKDITDHTRQSAPLKSRSERLQQLQGVGPVLAGTLLAYVPELGKVSDKTLASLIGVAPHPRDSGSTSRRRHVRGGRSQVHHVLYMAAVTAARCNPVLKPFYQRLRKEHGKPAKVALTAVMRRMLCVLNRLAADPNFSLV